MTDNPGYQRPQNADLTSPNDATEAHIMSMHRPPYAFHTTSPVVLEWWAKWKENEERHKEALERIAPEVAPYEGAEPAVVGVFGRYKFEGFKRDWGRDIPEGWKKSGRDGEWITPKVSTKAGKALVARMAEVPSTCDARRSDGGIPGMKLDMFFGQLPAMIFSETEVWAHFSDDWDHLDQIDQSIWAVRRISEYYAAKEARDDARKDEGQA